MRERKGVSWKEASLRGAEVNKKKKQRRVEEYDLNPFLCKHCEKPISYEKRRNKFCSHSCAASFNNQGIIRNATSGQWAKKECKNCGKMTRNRKCCSQECYSEWVKKERRKELIKLGSLISCSQDKWYLIEIRSHQCEICKNTKWNDRDIPLDIHHKDGDSDNNILDNVILICPNCHRQTGNHGSKNKNGKNSKRKRYRKDRYDKGLSY